MSQSSADSARAAALDFGLKRAQRSRRIDVVERLAPFHLLHQELARHCGVVLRIHRCVVQFAHIGSATHRILQTLISLVDANRPLHGDALSGRTLGSKTVGMRLALKLFPARVERGTVLREGLRNCEQFEIGVLKVHGNKKPPAHDMVAAVGAASDARDQILKLSPQPQRSRSFGLMNLKPSFKPSRTKSSLVPSM